MYISFFFFFNDTATTEIYTLSLHDALPILATKVVVIGKPLGPDISVLSSPYPSTATTYSSGTKKVIAVLGDRKSTRLNSSHVRISYAVFCLKKKTQAQQIGVSKKKSGFTLT